MVAGEGRASVSPALAAEGVARADQLTASSELARAAALLQLS